MADNILDITQNSGILDITYPPDGVISGGSFVDITGDPGDNVALKSALDQKADFPTANQRVPVRGATANQSSIPYAVTATADTIPLRGTGGVVKGGTALAADDLTTKAQMDTADALKVNKAGDGMTGQLTILNEAAVGFRQTRSSVTTTWGTSSPGRFVVTSANGSVGLSLANAGLRIGDDSTVAAQKLDVAGNARINGVDYLVGTGFPNGVASAPVGSIYIDTNITNGASSWIKKSGTGNTGWVLNEGDTGSRVVSPSDGTGNITLRRIGNTVHIRMSITTSSTITSGTTIYTLPAGFRPVTTVDTLYAQSGSIPNKLVAITAAGEIKLYGPTVSVITTANFTLLTAEDYPTTLPGTAV